MLSNDEIRDEVCNADFDWHYGWTLDDVEQNRFVTFARAIEAAVLAKMQAQSEPVGEVKQKQGYDENHFFVLWRKQVKPGDMLYTAPKSKPLKTGLMDVLMDEGEKE